MLTGSLDHSIPNLKGLVVGSGLCRQPSGISPPVIHSPFPPPFSTLVGTSILPDLCSFISKRGKDVVLWNLFLSRHNFLPFLIMSQLTYKVKLFTLLSHIFSDKTIILFFLKEVLSNVLRMI